MLTFSLQTCFDDMLKSGHYACPVCGVKNLLIDEIRLNFLDSDRRRIDQHELTSAIHDGHVGCVEDL